ncbi:hypothetical protein GCM10020358_23920 [Amorphoplanes nipponensis]|uniref:Uncharacterized protein n=1 Tax=Actinoplanes nipponensis TaxID=135950 RepID=A0A919JKM3_9ACTN|nr:hypothetical protein Ani05nite_46040 [Actinoplanes nipponensis]
MRARALVAFRLDRALRERRLVLLRRRIDRADKLTGYVVMLADSWLLMAVTDDGIRLNGFVAVRSADVVAVKRRPTDGFVGKALALQGTWPPTAPPDVDLTDIRKLITSVAEHFSLVSLHLEKAIPDVCFIGRLVGVRERSVAIREVSPRATWDREPTKWPLRKITRIDFGGAYENALSTVAGDPPPR